MRYLDDHGDTIVVRPAVEDALSAAVMLAFVAAPVVLITASIAAALMAGGDGRAFLAGWAIGAALAAPIALAGLARMATARGRTARGAVRIDLAERLVKRAGQRPDVLRGVRAVSVRARGWPWTQLALELRHDDARVTPLVRAGRGAGGEITSAAEHLADALGVDVEIPAAVQRARPVLPRDPRVASALCHAPVDGLFVIASLYYLMSSTDPFVRFNAKQSLLAWALEGLIALLALGCCGLPFALAVPAPLAIALPLVLVAVARAIVRTVAAVRARHGMVWVQPWLAPLARRWAPR